VTRRRQRLVLLGVGAAAVAVAAALVLSALGDSLTFFYGPSQILARADAATHRVRLGGLVEPGSVHRDGAVVRFVVTDGAASLPVRYAGVLPDLFREGQGVVAEGRMTPDGGFVAETVLAKHDEKYMPPDVAKVLRENGEWRPAQ
jgi:cytochrome c-type biogenesis protein CcmE